MTLNNSIYNEISIDFIIFLINKIEYIGKLHN